MKTFAFWLPIIISLIVTPFALLLSIGSAGGGHEDYFWAKIFFPYTMLSTFLFESITIPFIIIAIIQFPFYGLILAFATKKKNLGLLIILLGLVHFLASASSLFLLNETFL